MPVWGRTSCWRRPSTRSRSGIRKSTSSSLNPIRPVISVTWHKRSWSRIIYRRRMKEAQRQEGSDYHVPVLLKEVIDYLQPRPGGVYVDCTFGGGGHSRAILEALGPEGRLIAYDQDADAERNLPDDPRITFVPHNFRHLQRFLRLHGVEAVDGILADLGVSSHQFNEAERGFSTRFDAALDMRMDQRQEKTAYNVVQTYGEGQLHKLFEQY